MSSDRPCPPPFPCLTAYGQMVDDLDEGVMMVQTFLTMKAVAPFREETQELLKQLSETADVIERWLKVQMMVRKKRVVVFSSSPLQLPRQLPLV